MELPVDEKFLLEQSDNITEGLYYSGAKPKKGL